MRTGNKSTNDGTGERYEEVFSKNEMKNEKENYFSCKKRSKNRFSIGKRW